MLQVINREGRLASYKELPFYFVYHLCKNSKRHFVCWKHGVDFDTYTDFLSYRNKRDGF